MSRRRAISSRSIPRWGAPSRSAWDGCGSRAMRRRPGGPSRPSNGRPGGATTSFPSCSMPCAPASPSARFATRSERFSVSTSPRWSFSLITGLALLAALAAPAAAGLAVQVDGDRVYMDLSQKDGVLLGQEYTIFRKGEVFRHPSNGKPLGRYEDILGYAQVLRVEPSFAEAAFVPIEGKPHPQPEDGVRITRGRVRVAVVPPTDLTKANADLRRVPFMLSLAMDQTKRFQSVDPGQVNELLLNSKMKGEE